MQDYVPVGGACVIGQPATEGVKNSTVQDTVDCKSHVRSLQSSEYRSYLDSHQNSMNIRIT